MQSLLYSNSAADPTIAGPTMARPAAVADLPAAVIAAVCLIVMHIRRPRERFRSYILAVDGVCRELSGKAPGDAGVCGILRQIGT